MTTTLRRRDTEARGRRRLPGRLFRHLLGAESGQGLAEFALALPVILVILFGMVEFTYAYDKVHGLAGLSREGANIASRGTALTEVLSVVSANGQTLDLPNRGGAIVSRLVVRSGVPTVEAQVSTLGYENDSRLLDKGVAAQWLVQAGFSEGATHYAVEVFLSYAPLTPLPGLARVSPPSVLYQRAIF